MSNIITETEKPKSKNLDKNIDDGCFAMYKYTDADHVPYQE